MKNNVSEEVKEEEENECEKSYLRRLNSRKGEKEEEKKEEKVEEVKEESDGEEEEEEQDEDSEEEEEEEEEEEGEEEEEEESGSTLASRLLRAFKAKKISDLHIKMEIVKICQSVLAFPEKELWKVEALLKLSDFDELSKGLRRASLLSAVAVFKDIIPAYKFDPDIRSKSLQEGQKLSKGVLFQQKYEKKFLDLYKNGLLKRLKTRKEGRGLAQLALHGAAEFNYGEEVIMGLVGCAGGGDGEAKKALEQLLSRSDDSFQASETSRCVVVAIGRERRPQRLEHLVGLLKWTKTDMAERAEGMLERGLPLGSDELDSHSKSLLRGLEEAEGRGSHASVAKLRKTEAVTLAEIFVVFLRVLKAQHSYSTSSLIDALKGLGEKAEGVNYELLNEILEELRGIVRSRLRVKKVVSPEDAEVGSRALLSLLRLTNKESSGSALISADVAFLSEFLPVALEQASSEMACELCQEALMNESQATPDFLATLAGGLLENAVLDFEGTEKSGKSLESLVNRRPMLKACFDREGGVLGLDKSFCFFWELLSLKYHFNPHVSRHFFARMARHSVNLRTLKNMNLKNLEKIPEIPGKSSIFARTTHASLREGGAREALTPEKLKDIFKSFE